MTKPIKIPFINWLVLAQPGFCGLVAGRMAGEDHIYIVGLLVGAVVFVQPNDLEGFNKKWEAQNV